MEYLVIVILRMSQIGIILFILVIKYIDEPQPLKTWGNFLSTKGSLPSNWYQSCRSPSHLLPKPGGISPITQNIVSQLGIPPFIDIDAQIHSMKEAVDKQELKIQTSLVN